MPPNDLEGSSNLSASQRSPRFGYPSATEATRKQEQLLEVALDIFLEQGFERATMEDIARAAQSVKAYVLFTLPT